MKPNDDEGFVAPGTGDALAPAPRTSRTDELVKQAVDKALPNASEEVRRAAGQVIAPWAETLVRSLDDLIRIPGTRFGIGLDAVLGFILPGAGDIATGVGSTALLFLALKHRIPTVVIGRMLLNIGIDSAVGTIPILGDLFDVFFMSNRRNLELIEKYKDNPKEKPSTSDYLLVVGGIILSVLGVILPMIIFWTLIGGGILTCAGVIGSQATQ
jgi:hypothetical protein